MAHGPDHHLRERSMSSHVPQPVPASQRINTSQKQRAPQLSNQQREEMREFRQRMDRIEDGLARLGISTEKLGRKVRAGELPDDWDALERWLADPSAARGRGLRTERIWRRDLPELQVGSWQRDDMRQRSIYEGKDRHSILEWVHQVSEV